MLRASDLSSHSFSCRASFSVFPSPGLSSDLSAVSERHATSRATNLVSKGKENAFTFDRVFGGTSRQEDVYASVASEAIQDVLNGFHATVFACNGKGEHSRAS